MAALELAATSVGARVRTGALDAFRGDTTAPATVDYLVSIRKEDRERFEETIHPALARWVGETEVAPGIRNVPDHTCFSMDFHEFRPYTSQESRE